MAYYKKLNEERSGKLQEFYKTGKAYNIQIPTSSAESFELLEKKKIISRDRSEKLIKMTKFRNIVIHSYQQVKIVIVKSVILNDLDDLLFFADEIKNNFC